MIRKRPSLLPVVLRACALLGPAIACAPSFSATPVAAAPTPRPLLVTIDDLPVAAGRLHDDPADRARITRGLLDVLARHRVPAVGFVIWNNVRTEADRALLGSWLAAGLELGNHSASHPNLSNIDAAAYVADVEAARAGLAALLAAHGKTGPRFYRYPFLHEGDTAAKRDAVRAALAASGQRPAVVTIDTQDWSYEARWVDAARAGDRERMADVAGEYLGALEAEVRHYDALGDDLFGRPVPQVLLLHANAVGAANWDRLFTWLERTGHRFATADEVYADAAFAVPTRFLATYGCSQWDRIARDRAEDAARAAVETLLAEQAAAWNRGDLDAFGAAYADDATFSGGTSVTRGRADLVARYRKKYPTPAAMGRLSFAIEEVRFAAGGEITPLDDSVPGRVQGVSVLARWTLAYPDRPVATGTTLLVLHRISGKWLIVQDASS